jgi:MYXO-CTERM domain-containing protein
MLDRMLSRLAPSVFAGLLLASTAASADILWKGDFETNDLSQWGSTLNLKTGQRTNITVVSSTVREGKYAAQLVVHPDDLWPNGHNRVELHQDGKRTGEGETTFFSWYFHLPVNVTLHEDIGYWETNGPDYQQTMAFFVEPKNAATQISFRTNKPSSKIHWTAPLSVGQWHQLAVEIFWSQNATSGKVSVWLDGAMVVDHVTAQTKPNAASVFTQVGFHRDSTNPSVDTIFIDDAREGTTLDDVLAKTTAADAGIDSSGGGVNEAGSAGVGGAGPATGAGGTAVATGGSSGSGGSGVANTAGASGTSSVGASGGSGGARTGPAGVDSLDGGCSCSLASSQDATPYAWTGLVVIGAASRRRRKKRLVTLPE